jgi:hypothetical protein
MPPYRPFQVGNNRLIYMVHDQTGVRLSDVRAVINSLASVIVALIGNGHLVHILHLGTWAFRSRRRKGRHFVYLKWDSAERLRLELHKLDPANLRTLRPGHYYEDYQQKVSALSEPTSVSQP